MPTEVGLEKKKKLRINKARGSSEGAQQPEDAVPSLAHSSFADVLVKIKVLAGNLHLGPLRWVKFVTNKEFGPS